MKVEVTNTPLEGVVIVQTKCFEDERGFFTESWNQRDFEQAGLAYRFVQESHSRSQGRVIRGLHFQNQTAPLGKLVRCTVGCIFDVAVDLRVASTTFGQWFGLELSADNKRQLYVPEGFGHGFATLSDVAEVQYKQTGYYTPVAERAVAWNDPDLCIDWPYDNPVLSDKDRTAPSLKDYLRDPAF